MDETKYQVSGLKITKIGIDGKYVFIRYQADDVEFSIAKDSMGTQICRGGSFFPKLNDFGSIEVAVDYLRRHTEEAIEFFDAPNKPISLFDLILAMH